MIRNHTQKDVSVISINLLINSIIKAWLVINLSAHQPQNIEIDHKKSNQTAPILFYLYLVMKLSKLSRGNWEKVFDSQFIYKSFDLKDVKSQKEIKDVKGNFQDKFDMINKVKFKSGTNRYFNYFDFLNIHSIF